MTHGRHTPGRQTQRTRTLDPRSWGGTIILQPEEPQSTYTSSADFGNVGAPKQEKDIKPQRGHHQFGSFSLLRQHDGTHRADS